MGRGRPLRLTRLSLLPFGPFNRLLFGAANGNATMDRFTFPGWVDRVVRLAPVLAGLGAVYAAAVVWYCFSPKTTDVGYQPEQPVPFSHALHAGQLKMDCRYCHNTVERAAYAAIPPTGTCLNCHSPNDPVTGQPALTAVHPASPKLKWVRHSAASGEPIPWKKVHDLPDYSYFNHSSHVTKGVSCVSCHGRIDKMEVVYQHETLAMGWCLECHRNPAPNLRPPEEVTNLAWDPGSYAERLEIGNKQLAKWDIPTNAGQGLFHPQLNHNTNCSTCHR